MKYLGDFNLNDTINLPFNTNGTDGSSISFTGNVSGLLLYKDSTATHRASWDGITLNKDFAGFSGCHIISIDTSNNSDVGFYAISSDYEVMCSGFIVDSVPVNSFLGAFSLQNRYSDVTNSGQLAQATWEYTTRELTSSSTYSNIYDVHISGVLDTIGGSGQIANAVWDDLIANHNIVGTFGSKNQLGVPSETLNDYKATGFSTHSAADVWSVTNRILTNATNLSGIISQAVWEYTSRLLTGSDNLNIPTSGQIADTVWDEILTGATHNINNSAGKRLRQLGDAVTATVNDVSATTTSFITTLTSSVDNFYNDQLLRFTTGNLIGQAKPILSYYGSTKTIVLSEELTSAPANGDEFDILPQHIHPVIQIASGTWEYSDRYLTSATNLSGVIAQHTWEYPTRVLTADTNINYPSSGNIASAVWNNVSRILTSNANLNIPTSGQNAQSVWEYTTRELTSAGAGGATAEEVWEYTNRTLTSGNVQDIPQAVWQYGTRTLTADTNINYPTSGQIAGAVWNQPIRILTANTNFNDPTAATISSQVASDLLSAHGAGAWTTANVSSLATTSQLMSVSGDVVNKINVVDGIVDYSSGVLDTINQNVSYILIYNNNSGVPLTAAERNSIADAILQRSMSFVEDTSTEYTLCTLILAGLNSNVAGNTRFIKKTDNSAYVSQTVTTDAAAVPIIGVS